MDSDLFDEDHELFRASVRGFVDRHVVPNLQKWDADRLIDRETWRAAGKQGILGLAAPNEFGGAGEQDYRAPWRCDGAGEAGTRRTSGGRRTSTPAGPPRHRIAYPNRAAGRRTRRVRPRQPEHRREALTDALAD
jgi:alkylation response protein AidB-like acyl-CoA dehydrogenase